MPITFPVRKNLVLGIVVICWAALVTAGLGRLWTYATTPGPAADARAQWPTDSRVARVPGRPTLIVLLHPQCACSRATVGELARLMAHAPRAFTAYALIYQPSDMGEDWGGTALRDQARAVPGVHVSSDIDGSEARRFGGYVSGQTFLYDERGTLAFSGGITYARGHSGDNAGLAALEALLRGDAPQTRRTPVFGCLIGQSWEASS